MIMYYLNNYLLYANFPTQTSSTNAWSTTAENSTASNYASLTYDETVKNDVTSTSVIPITKSMFISLRNYTLRMKNYNSPDR